MDITDSAVAMARVAAAVAMDCTLAKELTPEPSSAVAAMAANTAARLASVTPVMPSCARSPAVNDGLGEPPDAVKLMASTIRASSCNLARVSTLEAVPASTMAFNRSASAVVLITVKPRVWNCAAVSVALPLAVPSAAFRIAL